MKNQGNTEKRILPANDAKGHEWILIFADYETDDLFDY